MAASWLSDKPRIPGLAMITSASVTLGHFFTETGKEPWRTDVFFAPCDSLVEKSHTWPFKFAQVFLSRVVLENYTRQENLRFMNIPERRGENCQDIIYDVLENDLKMNIQDIRFHAVHRVGKPQRNGATPARPRPIIARFAVREDRDAVFNVKNPRNPERKKNPYTIHVCC